jgi:flagellar basal-body rod modification protein FlgD
MADAISSTQTENATATNGTGQTVNPRSILDKDAFMKLFLAELQNQDPTNPMDTDKMITQTANLTSVESMENVQKSIAGLVNSFKATSGMETISAVGKVADTGLDAFNLTEGGESIDFELFFESDFTQAEIYVFDGTGNVVNKFTIPDGKEGMTGVKWNGTNQSGNPVDPGVYRIEATYKDAARPTANEYYATKMGLYPIESVIFGGDEVQVRLGNEYFNFSDIREIMEPRSNKVTIPSTTETTEETTTEETTTEETTA